MGEISDLSWMVYFFFVSPIPIKLKLITIYFVPINNSDNARNASLIDMYDGITRNHKYTTHQFRTGYQFGAIIGQIVGLV